MRGTIATATGGGGDELEEEPEEGEEDDTVPLDRTAIKETVSSSRCGFSRVAAPDASLCAGAQGGSTQARHAVPEDTQEPDGQVAEAFCRRRVCHILDAEARPSVR